MTETTRRKAIKGLAATAPVLWAKPIVDSVMLPVHAQTSPDDDDDDGPGCADIVFEMTSPSSEWINGQDLSITIRVTNNSDQPFDVSDDDEVSFSTESISGFFPGGSTAMEDFIRALGVVPAGDFREDTQTSTAFAQTCEPTGVGGPVVFEIRPRIPSGGERCDFVTLSFPCGDELPEQGP